MAAATVKGRAFGAGTGAPTDLTGAQVATIIGYTAADVLAKLLTVDGTGSGLDADLLGGVASSDYARLSQANTFLGGALTISGGTPFLGITESDQPTTTEQNWGVLANAKILTLNTYGASFGTGRGILQVTRGSGVAITDITLGNTTDNPTLNVAGTGLTTLGGGLTVTGTVTVPNTSFTYAKLQNVSATSRVLGRITAGAGVIEELTGANLATIIGTSLGANPSASVGLTAVNGSAGTYMRSDGSPALSQSIAPAWSGVHNWSAKQQVFGTTTANLALVSGLADTGAAIHAVEQTRIHRVGAEPFAIFLRVNGSYAAPSAVLTGHSMGELNFGGYNGSAIAASSCRMFYSASEDWTTTANGGTLLMQVTTTGTTTKATVGFFGSNSTGSFARFPAGAVTQPGIQFDALNGLYRINTNQIGVSCNGTLVLDMTTATVAITATTLRLNTTTATTVGAAGAASALPANPLGYISANIGGTAVKIPYYNN
jgi:hypothetical protein